jgi:hypothetical protein
MAYAQWNEWAEIRLVGYGLSKDEVEPLLRARIDAGACEPYGARGRLRTVIKIGKRGRFEVQFSMSGGNPWIQELVAEEK